MTHSKDPSEFLAKQLSGRGFLTPTQLTETVGKTNTLLSLDGILISRGVTIGERNTFYPGVVIEQTGDGAIEIGDDNVFYPNTYIFSSAGRIAIANSNLFGPAGLTIRANIPEAVVEIGSGGRFCDGANIMGNSKLGDGSQVLGAITTQSCHLDSGLPFSEPNPDLRAPVLKGMGFARNISLTAGEVLNGNGGDFGQLTVERQRSYHPTAK